MQKVDRRTSVSSENRYTKKNPIIKWASEKTPWK